MKNKSINIVKAISALFVVFIHCKFPGKLGIIVDSLARFAVPIFFMISGYYCFIEDKINFKNKINKRILNILKMLVISHCVYLIWNITTKTKENIGVFIKSVFGFKALIKILIFNESPVAIHLWFLVSLLYCYISIKIYNKKIYNKIVNLLIVITLIINIFLGEILSFFGIIIPKIIIRNYWFLGMPFFMLGYLIHQYEKIILDKLSNKKIIISCIIGSIVTVIERILIGKNELYIGSIVLTIGIFLIAIKNPKFERGKFIEKIGDEYSEMIYLYHIMVLEIINRFSIWLNIQDFKIYIYTYPLIVFIMSLINAYIIRRYNTLILCLRTSLFTMIVFFYKLVIFCVNKIKYYDN